MKLSELDAEGGRHARSQFSPHVLMARRGHYGFERRRRADLQRAKQEAKRQRKSDRTESGTTGPEMGAAQDTGAPAGMWEWFSPTRTRTVALPARTRPPADEPNDWVLLTEVAPEDIPSAE